MSHVLPVLSVLLLVSLGVGLGLVVPTIRRLLSPSKIEEISSDWLEGFSVRAYDAMNLLLSEDDFHFLSCQPGFDLALHRKLRRDRLQIFRQYLHRMIVDFNRLHLVARVMIAHTQEDQSELVVRLAWLKLKFSVEVFRAQANFWLCWFSVRAIGVQALISHLEELSLTLGPAFSPGAQA